MKRRTFIKSLFGASIVGGGLWTYLEHREVMGMIGSAITMGQKSVDNARTVPGFVSERFRQTPSVRFLVIGDWGSGNRLQRRVARQMAHIAQAENPQFVMSTGDNIYPAGVESARDKQWQSKFENIYDDVSLDIPWYAVLGNHDHRSDPDAQVAYTEKSSRWNMPGRTFRISQAIDERHSVDFFALDTQLINTGDKASTRRQCSWLEKELQASTAHWKIVFGHHMLRSHGTYGDQKRMLRTVKPILDSYGVDMYINGHDHDLQLLKSPKDSFHCLISGGGSGARNTSWGDNTIFAATNGGFAYVAITEDALYSEFIDSHGKTLYAHTLPKSS